MRLQGKLQHIDQFSANHIASIPLHFYSILAIVLYHSSTFRKQRFQQMSLSVLHLQAGHAMTRCVCPYTARRPFESPFMNHFILLRFPPFGHHHHHVFQPCCTISASNSTMSSAKPQPDSKSSTGCTVLIYKDNPACFVCGESSDSRCVCTLTFDCGRTCQKTDWPRHKSRCKSLAEAFSKDKQENQEVLSKRFVFRSFVRHLILARGADEAILLNLHCWCASSHSARFNSEHSMV